MPARVLTLLALLLALVAVGQAHAAEPSQPPVRSWACYYGAKPIASLTRFDLLALESSNLPAPAKRKGRPLSLGYASLGEVDMDGRFWGDVQDKPFVLGKNNSWNSRFVDIRDPAWRAFVLERILPPILERGYDGFFLDTLDSSIHLEQTDPERHAGMIDAAVEFVREIRRRHPGVLLCVNRAAPILERLAPEIDFTLLECLFSDYDFETKKYRATSASDRDQLLGAARAAKRANPRLTLLSLDYADPKDAKRIDEAIAHARKNGLVPYVATVALDRVSTRTLRR
ncbi:hypothetical protein NNJEOMEG_02987 [Fundidesulfovibrio magnetotacticus]|uniref:Glycoside-hydrolase family GH114 TIM-barrel domain-containing protein n=1 Tax=Fundidesulfovibrio magnetotacticus TaxID=2730080 RepID=A0A6V8LYN9_9BACT|nr:endo alpha-1,4 polygalactosaminidase [Fundidesulfovibrio magnetotacticus]GFK95129.1 hypothetical protein NNJEOMEG_02987 [Fundidesulfovibrio magnetotacticus]